MLYWRSCSLHSQMKVDRMVWCFLWASLNELKWFLYLSLKEFMVKPT